MGLEPFRDWAKAVVKASLFSSFGAGLGIGLGAVIAICVMAVISSGLPYFECSTAKLCGLSIVNLLLALLAILVGAGAMSVFAAVIGCVYALPIALLVGGILTVLGRCNHSFWNNRWLHLPIGAVFGIIWWLLLAQLQLLPFFGALSAEGGSAPNPVQILTSGVVALPALGGSISAEMFRRWMLTELLALNANEV